MSEIYFSVDIETDGPIPGQNSMLSLGAVALDTAGNELSTFTINFTELNGAVSDKDTMEWWAKQPAIIVEAARSNPQPPLAAIHQFDHWVRMVAGEREAKPVFVGYPAGFDFLFVYWYLVKFTGGSPFSFSALDIKTFAMAAMGTGYRDVSKKTLEPFMPKDLRHTHVALDDAREQGQLFINLLKHARGVPKQEGSLRLKKVIGCARCNGNHENVFAQAFITPFQLGDETWTHWATCPRTNEPVLVSKSTP
jgi:hypothetical protein